MTRSLFLASVAIIVFATPALADCLQVGRIDRWRALDDTTVIARDLTHHEHKVSLNGICPNLKFNETIALKANANSGLDCVRPGDRIVVKAFNNAVTCSIRSVEPYTAPRDKMAPDSGAGPGSPP